jgi:hypothetical protein
MSETSNKFAEMLLAEIKTVKEELAREKADNELLRNKVMELSQAKANAPQPTITEEALSALKSLSNTKDISPNTRKTLEHASALLVKYRDAVNFR